MEDAEHSAPEFIAKISIFLEPKVDSEKHGIHASMIHKKLVGAINADIEEIKKILWEEYRCDLLVCPTSVSPLADAHQ